MTCQANRECIGIVTKIDLPEANIPMADRWLEIAGCKTIFHVNSKEGVGVAAILEYLKSDEEKGTIADSSSQKERQ